MRPSPPVPRRELLNRKKVKSVQYSEDRESILVEFKARTRSAQQRPRPQERQRAPTRRDAHAPLVARGAPNGKKQRIHLPYDADLFPKLVEMGVAVDSEQPRLVTRVFEGAFRLATPLLALGGLAYIFQKTMEARRRPPAPAAAAPTESLRRRRLPPLPEAPRRCERGGCTLL